MCAITLLYFLKHKINFKFNSNELKFFIRKLRGRKCTHFIVEMSYLMSNAVNTHFLIIGFKAFFFGDVKLIMMLEIGFFRFKSSDKHRYSCL